MVKVQKRGYSPGQGKLFLEKTLTLAKKVEVSSAVRVSGRKTQGPFVIENGKADPAGLGIAVRQVGEKRCGEAVFGDDPTIDLQGLLVFSLAVQIISLLKKGLRGLRRGGGWSHQGEEEQNSTNCRQE